MNRIFWLPGLGLLFSFSVFTSPELNQTQPRLPLAKFNFNYLFQAGQKTKAPKPNSFHPFGFKGLTPQEIMNKIKEVDGDVKFNRVYNRDEWIANDIEGMDFFSIDATGDRLFIKLREKQKWTAEQAIEWLGNFEIQLTGNPQKIGPRNWEAKVSGEYLETISLIFNQDSDEPEGTLFVLGLSYKKGGNPWDKVVFRDGRVIECEVVESGQMSIKYKLPDESVLMGASKNRIKHILYRSGRLEQGALLPVINGPEDWHKVILTTNPADVEGLKRITQLKGRSGWGGSMGGNLGNAGARRSLQKAAAKLKAPIVLLQDKSSGGSTVIVGVAYK